MMPIGVHPAEHYSYFSSSIVFAAGAHLMFRAIDIVQGHFIMIKLLSRRAVGFALLATVGLTNIAAAAPPSEIVVDWATYNPVSLVLRDQQLLEKEFQNDGIKIRWVQSAGSNKALEFLSAGSIDFGSTAGAAALIGAINGNPIKSVFVYSRPEWTALVAKKDSDIKSVSDLKGRRVAVTRGTDPHIFLVRALADQKLTEKDIKVVPLQHADGRLALSRGDVDAWAGLDPIMASAELEDGARLFFRNDAANTWGVLNVRTAFANEHPDIVRRVLAVYEKARKWSVDNPRELAKTLVGAAKLPDAVIDRQLERTNLSYNAIGSQQKDTLVAGIALQQAGVITPDVDIRKQIDQLIDPSFYPAAP